MAAAMRGLSQADEAELAALRFFDQSHLNRECLRLTGSTPAAFLGETAYRCADGHDHAASFRPVLQQAMAELFRSGEYQRIVTKFPNH